MTESRTYYLFNEGITHESANKLIQFINTNTGQITISITSEGGLTQLGRTLVHILNENKERIILIATEYVYSCAFKIFKAYTGKKYMTYGCLGMYHYGAMDIKMSYDNKPNYKREGVMHTNYLGIMKTEDEKWCRKFLTTKEMKEYCKNEDIYFTFTRMKQINKDAEII